MAMIGYRPRPNAQGRVDDLTVLVQQRLWVRTIFFFWLYPVLPRKFWYEMVPTTSLRSSINELEWKAIKKIEEMREIFADHEVMSDALEREIKDELGSRLYDRVSGECEAFFLDDKVFKERIKPYSERPPEDALTSFLNPKIVRQYKLNRKPVDEHFGYGGRPAREHRALIPGEPGSNIAVTLPEHSQFATHIRNGNSDLDQFVTHKDEQAKSGGTDKKSQMKQIRSDNPYSMDRWDNQKEWNEWIEQEWKERFGPK